MTKESQLIIFRKKTRQTWTFFNLQLPNTLDRICSVSIKYILTSFPYISLVSAFYCYYFKQMFTFAP